MTDTEQVVDQVRARYDEAARQGSSCCGVPCGAEAEVALQIGYAGPELAGTEEANLGLGCGAPVGRLGLRAGETVLDLGSGPGLDAILAARQVGPGGRVIGVDMTPSMIERARATVAKIGLSHVEFREGRLEALPVADASVDAVTSNCVINLVPDKGAVFREIARVLRPGGRLVVSDIVLERPLPDAIARDVYAYVGCIGGAAVRSEYFALLERAGLGAVEVLSDVDYLAKMTEVAPEEVDTVLRRTGTPREAVTGVVRSVTYRATRT